MRQSPAQKYAAKRNFLLGRLCGIRNSLRTTISQYDLNMYLSTEDMIALTNAMLLVGSVLNKWDTKYVKKKMEAIECKIK